MRSPFPFSAPLIDPGIFMTLSTVTALGAIAVAFMRKGAAASAAERNRTHEFPRCLSTAKIRVGTQAFPLARCKLTLSASPNNTGSTSDLSTQTQRKGSLSTLFPDFQRYPMPGQTGLGPLPRARALPGRARLECGLKLISRGSVKQADRPGRRRPAFRP